MILLLDNYDSFTYNLADYLGQLGLDYVIRRNDEPVKDILNGNYSSVIIGPGPEVPVKSGHLMHILEHYQKHLPVLGICLGHQAIGEFFGASLERAYKPMHGKVCQIKVHEQEWVFRNLPDRISVVRYNSLILKGLADDLVVTATSDSGEIMALRHSERPIYGLQFHPEAILTEFGLKMLQNWIECSERAF